jgi:cobalamin-dependent methionine synthase I
MDMGIVNAGALPLYTDVPEDLRILCENAIWNLDPESTEKILTYAQTHGVGAKKEAESEQWRETSPEERIRHALVKGVDKYIVEDVEEARLNKAKVSFHFFFFLFCFPFSLTFFIHRIMIIVISMRDPYTLLRDPSWME